MKLSQTRILLPVLYRIVAFGLLIAFSPGAARADDATTARKVIEKQYYTMEHLLLKRDVPAYMKLLSSDYSHRSLTGENWDRSTFLKVLWQIYRPSEKEPANSIPGSQPTPLPPASSLTDRHDDKHEIVVTDLLHFKYSGDQVADQRITVHVVPYTNPDGTSNSIHIFNYSEDLWAKSGDSWLLKHRRDLNVDMKIINNPMNTPAAHKQGAV